MKRSLKKVTSWHNNLADAEQSIVSPQMGDVEITIQMHGGVELAQWVIEETENNS